MNQLTGRHADYFIGLVIRLILSISFFQSEYSRCAWYLDYG